MILSRSTIWASNICCLYESSQLPTHTLQFELFNESFVRYTFATIWIESPQVHILSQWSNKLNRVRQQDWTLGSNETKLSAQWSPTLYGQLACWRLLYHLSGSFICHREERVHTIFSKGYAHICFVVIWYTRLGNIRITRWSTTKSIFYVTTHYIHLLLTKQQTTTPSHIIQDIFLITTSFSFLIHIPSWQSYKGTDHLRTSLPNQLKIVHLIPLVKDISSNAFLSEIARSNLKHW